VQYIFNYASKEYVGRRMLVDIVTVEGLPSYISRYDKWLSERGEFCLSQLLVSTRAILGNGVIFP
jgi:hypothetical protein